MGDTNSSSSKPSVLIVEDDRFLSDILARKAKDTFSLHYAATGEEALLKAKEVIPDVILLDLHLPDSNGFDILKQIRSSNTLSNTLVLILTNSVMNEDALKSHELKADDFLTKANISIEEIIDKINKHLAEKST